MPRPTPAELSGQFGTMKPKFERYDSRSRVPFFYSIEFSGALHNHISNGCDGLQVFIFFMPNGFTSCCTSILSHPVDVIKALIYCSIWRNIFPLI